MTAGKEQAYRFSHLWRNRDLQALAHGNVAQVKARADRIAQRFPEVWPAPGTDVLADTDGKEVNIFDAEERGASTRFSAATGYGSRRWPSCMSRCSRNRWRSTRGRSMARGSASGSS